MLTLKYLHIATVAVVNYLPPNRHAHSFLPYSLDNSFKGKVNKATFTTMIDPCRDFCLCFVGEKESNSLPPPQTYLSKEASMPGRTSLL